MNFLTVDPVRENRNGKGRKMDLTPKLPTLGLSVEH